MWKLYQVPGLASMNKIYWTYPSLIAHGPSTVIQLFTTKFKIHSGSLQSMQTPDLETSLLSMYLEGCKFGPHGQKNLGWERLPGLQTQVPRFRWLQLSPENHMFCLLGQNRQASWPPSGLCSLATVKWWQIIPCSHSVSAFTEHFPPTEQRPWWP